MAALNLFYYAIINYKFTGQKFFKSINLYNLAFEFTTKQLIVQLKKINIMIRLNAFFEVKDNASIDAVKNLGTELVNKSRNDEGCVSYDLFTSATRPLVMMFCETWKDEEVLKAHIASAHFTELVPKIEALTKNGLKLEKFEF